MGLVGTSVSKVGRRSDAITLYQKRKTDARMGVKMPDNIRHRGVTFQTLANAILVHVEQHGYKDQRNVRSRLEKLSKEFGPLEAEKILPEHIADWLTKNTKTLATSNRYKATISLVFREGLRNRRVTTNPPGWCVDVKRAMSASATCFLKRSSD
jgi:hypothetical protein